jgi:hypothetical protein
MKLGNLIILRAGIRQLLPFNSMSFRMRAIQTLFVINLKLDFKILISCDRASTSLPFHCSKL